MKKNRIIAKAAGPPVYQIVNPVTKAAINPEISRKCAL